MYACIHMQYIQLLNDKHNYICISHCIIYRKCLHWKSLHWKDQYPKQLAILFLKINHPLLRPTLVCGQLCMCKALSLAVCK